MPSREPTRRRLLQSLAVGTVAGLAGCSAFASDPEPGPIPNAVPGSDDWPASGYDARNTRYNEGASPPRSEPDARWTYEFPFCYEPVVRGNRVVLNAGDQMVGLSATDGDLVWESESEPWGFETPTLGSERAYVTGTDCIFGVDLDTGDENWHGRPCHGANTDSGTIANGRLYLEYGGYFSALDATGRVAWASRHDVQGSPAIAEDTAYVATAFTAEAIDLTTAANEWPWEDPDDDEPPYATRSEATEWSVPPEPRAVGPRFYRSPAVAGSTVYVTVEREGRPGGELRALARDSGEERWRITSPPSSPPGEPTPDGPEPVGQPVSPIVTDELVVTSLGDRRLQALSPRGDSEWTTTLEREVTDLVAAGDVLVALTHNRGVKRTAPGHAGIDVFDLESGSRLWDQTFEDHVEEVAVAGGSIYATVVSGREADTDITEERLIALG